MAGGRPSPFDGGCAAGSPRFCGNPPHGLADTISGGPEYISGALLAWEERQGIRIEHIQPGKERAKREQYDALNGVLNILRRRRVDAPLQLAEA